MGCPTDGKTNVFPSQQDTVPTWIHLAFPENHADPVLMLSFSVPLSGTVFAGFQMQAMQIDHLDASPPHVRSRRISPPSALMQTFRSYQ